MDGAKLVKPAAAAISSEGCWAQCWYPAIQLYITPMLITPQPCTASRAAEFMWDLPGVVSMPWDSFTSPSAGAGMKTPTGGKRLRSQGRVQLSLGRAAGGQGTGFSRKSCSTSLTA